MANTYWLVAYTFQGKHGASTGWGRAFATLYRGGTPSAKDLISWEKQIAENDPSLGKVGITNFQKIEPPAENDSWTPTS